MSLDIADLALDPGAPFAVIGTNYELKGQASNLSWNPYIVAAKFVVHKIQAEQSIDALAKQIAASIATNRSSLEAHDPGMHSH